MNAMMHCDEQRTVTCCTFFNCKGLKFCKGLKTFDVLWRAWAQRRANVVLNSDLSICDDLSLGRS